MPSYNVGLDDSMADDDAGEAMDSDVGDHEQDSDAAPSALISTVNLMQIVETAFGGNDEDSSSVSRSAADGEEDAAEAKPSNQDDAHAKDAAMSTLQHTQAQSRSPSLKQTPLPSSSLTSGRIIALKRTSQSSVRFSDRELVLRSTVDVGASDAPGGFSALKDIESKGSKKSFVSGHASGVKPSADSARSTVPFRNSGADALSSSNSHTTKAHGSAKVLPVLDGDNRSGDGQSQVSKSTFQGYFRSIQADKTKEEPTLAVLRWLLMGVTLVVAAISVYSMGMAETLIEHIQHAAHSDNIDGDRLSAVLVSELGGTAQAFFISIFVARVWL